MQFNAPRHSAAPSFCVALPRDAAACGVHSPRRANKNGPGGEARAVQVLHSHYFAARPVVRTPSGLLARKARTCPRVPIGREVFPEPTPQI